MCLIIVNPPGCVLRNEHLTNGWNRNSDSAGYMFADNGKLIIRKPFYSLDALRESLDADRFSHASSSAFVIHFRYATHGDATELNCHPHLLCGGEVGLAHNGILDEFLPPLGADYSDTVHFCHTVLAYRRPADVMQATFNGILADMIGERNKFVLLCANGQTSIVNESKGVWESGNWYSNHGYLAPKPTLPFAYAERFAFDDDLAELDSLDFMIDEVGWHGLTADEQSEYLALHQKVYEPI